MIYWSSFFRYRDQNLIKKKLRKKPFKKCTCVKRIFLNFWNVDKRLNAKKKERKKNEYIIFIKQNKKDCEVVKCGTFSITKDNLPMTLFECFIEIPFMLLYWYFVNKTSCISNFSRKKCNHF